MPEAVPIRPARPTDAPALSALARRAKAHWGYPEALLRMWRDELTFTPATIAAQDVLVAEEAGAPIGVVALSYEGETAEVEHLWIDPAAVGRGLGRLLFSRAAARAHRRGARRLVIDSDPHAEAFYRRMGARRVGSTPSRPAGRALPRLVLALRGPAILRIDDEGSR